MGKSSTKTSNSKTGMFINEIILKRCAQKSIKEPVTPGTGSTYVYYPNKIV